LHLLAENFSLIGWRLSYTPSVSKRFIEIPDAANRTTVLWAKSDSAKVRIDQPENKSCVVGYPERIPIINATYYPALKFSIGAFARHPTPIKDRCALSYYNRLSRKENLTVFSRIRSLGADTSLHCMDVIEILSYRQPCVLGDGFSHKVAKILALCGDVDTCIPVGAKYDSAGRQGRMLVIWANPSPLTAHHSVSCNISLPFYLIKGSYSEDCRKYSSEEADELKADFDLFPYGLPLCLLGSVMFGYGYWKAKLGSNIDFKWLAVLVFGGLIILVYGVYLISDTSQSSKDIVQEFRVDMVSHPAHSFFVPPTSDFRPVGMLLSRPSLSHPIPPSVPRGASSCQL
jgi:hypothetical protein